MLLRAGLQAAPMFGVCTAARLPMLAARPPMLAARPPMRCAAVRCEASVDGVLALPELWATGTLVLLCATFWAFENAVFFAKKKTPPYVLPTIEAILTEMATLGFIGLIVGADLLGLEKGIVSELSEQFLGESEIAFELFEDLHTLLFETAVAFFFVIACTRLTKRHARQRAVAATRSDVT